MARIIFPPDFIRQSFLTQNIRTKVMADGVNSELIAYLTKHSIDLNDDDTNRLSAATHDKNRVINKSLSENYREQVYLQMVPLVKHLRLFIQYLKSFYKPEYAEVGTWGVTITTTGRVIIPTSFAQLMMLAEAFYTKFGTYAPGTSPLQPYLDQHNNPIKPDYINIANDITTFTNIVNEFASFQEYAGKSEDDTELRNNDFKGVMKHNRKIGNYLKNLHSNNPKYLTYYGFQVDDSPRAPKMVKSKIKLSSNVTISGLVIGGTFTNTGTVSLTFYKGKSASGTPTVVQPGEMAGIAAGYSIITVVNNSTLMGGTFSALRHR